MRTPGTSKGAVVPSVPLPEHASLEHLKKQAKLVQSLVRDADDGGLELVREFHPRSAEVLADPAGFRRSDAQLVVARLYGAPSWPELRRHVDLVAQDARSDPADRSPADAVDRFVSLACVSYAPGDVLGRLEQGRSMLAADPGLAHASLAAAAVAGDHGFVSRAIADDPGAVNGHCGPHEWPPLLYCSYSRIVPTDEMSTLATAERLLDAGADPNAGFLWRGLVPPFTALTGALGGGEIDQPAHPDRMALAEALLDAGADPNDGQALYNLGLGGPPIDDTSHLELLLRYGMGSDRGGPWYARFGDRLTPPEELWYDELEVAAHRGLPTRMRFLVGLDLDLRRPVGRSRQTPLALATGAGHDEVVAILRAAGA